MTTLKLIGFSGEIPRLQPRQLPEAAAQKAENVRLEDGGLVPIRKPRFAHHVADLASGSIKTIYRHNGEWLAWSTVVNACPGPVDGNRLYYTGDGKPKMRVGSAVYELAVPSPSSALTAVVSGTETSPDVYTRLYVYTFVTEFGEESEPSPITADIEWKAGQTVTLSGFQAAPSGRNITKQRIYRSQSSYTGTALYFIAERAASASSFTDNVPVDQFSEQLPSLTWNAPPDDLQGLIPLPNGMMAAFSGKDLYFCEPWRPHAWPQAYSLKADYNIVALGAYSNSIVVMTEGTPYIVSGSSPDSMLMEKMELNLPCINARGVVDLGYAVAYPSHDGLVIVQSGSARVVTDSLVSRTEWLASSPATFVSSLFAGKYFASYSYLDQLGKPQAGTFIMDLTGATPFRVSASEISDAFYYDLPTGALYFLVGQDIYEYDAQGQANDIMTWRSKQFVVPNPTNFGAMMIEGKAVMTPEEEAAAEAEIQEIADRNNALFNGPGTLGGELNGAAINVYPMNGDALERAFPKKFINVTVFSDGKQVANVSDMNRVVRLPAGFKGRIWEVEVNGTAEVAQIDMAGTPTELKGI